MSETVENYSIAQIDPFAGLKGRQLGAAKARAAKAQKCRDGIPFAGAAHKKQKRVPLSQRAERLRLRSLLDAIEVRPKKSEYLLPEVVEWVSSHLLYDVEMLKVDDIPNAQALSMWCWAKEHEDDFRSMYDSKRMPNRAQVERGFGMTDSGTPTDKLIEELLNIGADG